MNNTTYATGTISVGASSTTVAGVGTAWANSGVRAGDVLLAAGNIIPIASVNSNTSITLKRPWPSAALSGANYDILLLDDDVRSLVAANELLQALKAGTLTSLAGLAGGANKLPYFTGAGVMSQTDLSAFARTLLDDADAASFWATIGETSTPVQAFRRGNIVGTVSQSGGNPTGALLERGSNSNGEYVKFADGTMILTRSVTVPALSSTSNIGGMHRSDIVQLDFPASFTSSAIAVSGSLNSPLANALQVATGRPSGQSKWEYRVFGLSAFTDISAGTLSLMAIGRWF